MTTGPTPVDVMRNRAMLVIACRKPEDVHREANEVREWFINMNSAMPEKTLADLLPTWLSLFRGDSFSARASSYFAVAALIECDACELDRAEMLVQLAERASNEELLNRFSVSARASNAGSRDKNRPLDRLTEAIAELLRDEPKLTCKHVRKRLEASINASGPVLSVTDTLIEWVNRNGKVEESPTSGLKDRCTSAKKFNRRRADSGETG